MRGTPFGRAICDFVGCLPMQRANNTTESRPMRIDEAMKIRQRRYLHAKHVILKVPTSARYVTVPVSFAIRFCTA